MRKKRQNIFHNELTEQAQTEIDRAQAHVPHGRRRLRDAIPPCTEAPWEQPCCFGVRFSWPCRAVRTSCRFAPFHVNVGPTSHRRQKPASCLLVDLYPGRPRLNKPHEKPRQASAGERACVRVLASNGEQPTLFLCLVHRIAL